MQEGLLAFGRGQNADLKNISEPTKAFALDPARIYLNRKGKYPCGTVDPAESKELLCRLEDLFASLEADGRKVIKHVLGKHDVYSGPCLDDAPDMVLIAEEGFNLKANLRANQLTDKPIFTGKHTQHDAFLAVRGLPDEGLVPEAPSVSDVRAIMQQSRKAN